MLFLLLRALQCLAAIASGCLLLVVIAAESQGLHCILVVAGAIAAEILVDYVAAPAAESCLVAAPGDVVELDVDRLAVDLAARILSPQRYRQRPTT